MSVNKQYKDSVFSLLFNDHDALRELYGALEGALFMERINDLSLCCTTGAPIILTRVSCGCQIPSSEAESWVCPILIRPAWNWWCEGVQHQRKAERGGRSAAPAVARVQRVRGESEEVRC
ncbi:MAG: hypothetical protein LBL45_09995 [Treponema sp.]|jgi:hypothetical protein|nr:hypothetical protein [Treponema sp.]